MDEERVIHNCPRETPKYQGLFLLSNSSLPFPSANSFGFALILYLGLSSVGDTVVFSISLLLTCKCCPLDGKHTESFRLPSPFSLRLCQAPAGPPQKDLFPIRSWHVCVGLKPRPAGRLERLLEMKGGHMHPKAESVKRRFGSKCSQRRLSCGLAQPGNEKADRDALWEILRHDSALYRNSFLL